MAQAVEVKPEGYNGWKNYETWCVKLWMDNDEATYSANRERAQAAWNNAEATSYSTREQQARIDLADTLKDAAEEAAPDLGASVWADLLNAALGEVDWFEIAENLLSEVDTSDDAN